MTLARRASPRHPATWSPFVPRLDPARAFAQVLQVDGWTELLRGVRDAAMLLATGARESEFARGGWAASATSPPGRRPSVTVVIPCYNYGGYLPQAVSSAFTQSGLDIEVIVVDDASTDGSQDVGVQLAAQDARVTCVLHERNRGHIATYNDGLVRARGDYVVLMSADDLLPPNALTRAVALMEAHPRVGFCYGHAPTFSEQAPPARHRVRSWTVWRGQEWLMLCARRGRNPVMSPEVVMRREALLGLGGYDSSLPHAADLLLWLRTAAYWDVGRVNGSDQGFYRVHGGNMHLTSYAGALVDMQERCAAYEQFVAESGSRVADIAAFRTAVGSSLANEALALAISALDAEPRMTDEARTLADQAIRFHSPVRDTGLWTTYLALVAESPGGSVLARRGRRLRSSWTWKARYWRWVWAGV
jgi:hypothetical protein